MSKDTNTQPLSILKGSELKRGMIVAPKKHVKMRRLVLEIGAPGTDPMWGQ